MLQTQGAAEAQSDQQVSLNKGQRFYCGLLVIGFVFFFQWSKKKGVAPEEVAQLGCCGVKCKVEHRNEQYLVIYVAASLFG